MNREKVLEEIVSLPNNNILAELPTSFGKSRIAIELVKHRRAYKVLIVVPRNVLKGNWMSELNKWMSNDINYCVTFTTYVSLPKYAGKWDMVIFDECHHLSERCREALCGFEIKSSILLSATVKQALKDEFTEVFDNLYCYKVSVREAMESEVLPEPKVILLPLTLNNSFPDESIWFNPKSSGRIVDLPYAQIWTAKKNKSIKFRVYCTARQYYNELSSKIEWLKKKRHITALKNQWLHKCGERLKWLSDKKVSIVKEILEHLCLHRTLTFCNSIEQTELLGKYCINSKNKESTKFLDDFNKGNINHITAVNMLNEGMNLTNCRVGIYANLNSSETIIKQRLGRLLRHPNPVIIIPYFVNTREAELVARMLEDYNPELVSTVNFIKEIQI